MSALMNQARTRVPRIAEAAVERARLTVVPRAPGRSAARVPFVVLVSLLLVGGVAGLLCFNTSMQQASFTSTAMEERSRRSTPASSRCVMELDALRDPQRVAVKAQEMGMVPATSPAFIRLSDGKVLGKPTPATSENSLRITPLPTRKPANLRPTPIVIELKPSDVPTDAAKSSASDGAASADRRHRRPVQRRPTTAPASRGASVDPGQPPPSRRTTSGTAPAARHEPAATHEPAAAQVAAGPVAGPAAGSGSC